MKIRINNYFETLKQTLDNIDKDGVMKFVNLLTSAKGNIYIMGNGGSASTASHFACDFNKDLLPEGYAKVTCLNDNMSSVLAYSNDFGYENLFEEQLKRFLKKDDIVIVISCSGNSENILKAVDYAKTKNVKTIGLTGFDGGILKNKVDISICTNCSNMQITEDVHLAILHMVYNILREF